MFDGTRDSLVNDSVKESRMDRGRNQMITVHSKGAFEMEFAAPHLITSTKSSDIQSPFYGRMKASSSHFLSLEVHSQ